MAEVKKVNVNYHQIYSQDDAFYDILSEKLATMMDNNMDYGFYEVKNGEIMFKLYEHVELSGAQTYLVSLVKEKHTWPVWFNREGDVDEVPLDAGALGEITYGLIDPQKQVLLTLSSGISAPSAASFVQFMRWLTDDESAGAQPVYVTDAYDRVAGWDTFRKLTLSFEAPTQDYVDTILNTDAGRELNLVERLEGLRIDVSVSMGHSKGSLNNDAVKNYIRSIMTENFAKKLELTGKGFEESDAESYDLMKAKLKFSTEVQLNGTHVKHDDARNALLAAYLSNVEYINDLEPVVITDEDE